MEQKRALSFPLRLCPSVRQQATEISQSVGISLNYFISLAVAEKISKVHAAQHRQQLGDAPFKADSSLSAAYKNGLPESRGATGELKQRLVGDVKKGIFAPFSDLSNSASASREHVGE